MTAADYLRDPATDLTVVIPVGMPLGLRHPDGSAETVFRVRLNREVFALDDAMLGAWFLAHSMRHNRQSLAAVMADDGVADPIAAIESLVAGGLLVPTPVSAEGALLLATAYRMVPLMTGMGPHPDGGHIVGVPGIVEHGVGDAFYQVYRRATSSSSMLNAMVGALEERAVPGQTLDAFAAQLLGQLGAPLELGVVALDAAIPA